MASVKQLKKLSKPPIKSICMPILLRSYFGSKIRTLIYYVSMKKKGESRVKGYKSTKHLYPLHCLSLSWQMF